MIKQEITLKKEFKKIFNNDKEQRKTIKKEALDFANKCLPLFIKNKKINIINGKDIVSYYFWDVFFQELINCNIQKEIILEKILIDNFSLKKDRFHTKLIIESALLKKKKKRNSYQKLRQIIKINQKIEIL